MSVQNVFSRRDPDANAAQLRRWEAHTAERAGALIRLRRALEARLLVVMPAVHEQEIAQFRADLIALGVAPGELNAAGIR